MVGAEDLVIRANPPRIDGISQFALWTIRIRRTQSRSHCIQPHTQFVEQGRIQLSAHCRSRAAADKHLANSVYLREFLRQDGISGVIHFWESENVGSEGQDQNGRIGRINFPVRGIAGEIRRKLAAGGIDCRLHVAACSINVAIQIELQNDARRTKLAGRRHLINSGNPPELTFQRRGYGRSHGLRARARQTGRYLYYGKLHLRQRRDRKEVEGQRSRHQQRRRQ